MVWSIDLHQVNKYDYHFAHKYFILLILQFS